LQPAVLAKQIVSTFMAAPAVNFGRKGHVDEWPSAPLMTKLGQNAASRNLNLPEVSHWAIVISVRSTVSSSIR